MSEIYGTSASAPLFDRFVRGSWTLRFLGKYVKSYPEMMAALAGYTWKTGKNFNILFGMMGLVTQGNII